MFSELVLKMKVYKGLLLLEKGVKQFSTKV